MAKKKTPAPVMPLPTPSLNVEEVGVVYRDPEKIMPSDNIRFSLLPHVIEERKKDIMNVGKIEVPMEVRELSSEEKATNPQFDVRLVKGGYRHAASLALNAEGAGLRVPTIMAVYKDRLSEIKRQIAENVQRQSMSPMDTCNAIHKMFDAGASRIEVREAFPTTGGAKGNEIRPASNAHINMLARFKDFSKKIQTRIHDGRIGVEAAYTLWRKYKADDWDRIADQIESTRVKAEEAADKEEQKFLAGEKKASTAAERESKVQSTLTEATTLVAQTGEAEKAAHDALKVAFDKKVAAKSKEEIKAAQESFKAAENTLSSAKSEYGKAKDGLKKAEDAKKSMEEKKTPTPKAAKTAGPAEVHAAAKQTGSEATQHVALKAKEMREAVISIIKLSTPQELKTRAVGQALIDCFDGKISDDTFQDLVAKLVGERKAPAKPVKK